VLLVRLPFALTRAGSVSVFRDAISDAELDGLN
jgi:hypothetical protein